MCTGNPRSRETGVSCADWQRPAAVPLPAWEQGGPQQPHQESSAHHHQVQYNSTLRFYSVEHSIRPPYWGDLGWETFQWVCFYWRDNKNRLTLSITRLLDSFPVDITPVWKTWVKPESMSHVFSLFSISPELSAWSWSLLKQTPLHTVLLAVIFDFNYPHPSKPFSSPVRLVHSGPGKSSPLLDSDLSFGLRTGTKQGVETHVFRVDSAKDLSTWTHLLVEGCHSAAELIKEVTTGEEPASAFLHWKIRMFRSRVNLYHLFLGVARLCRTNNEESKCLARSKKETCQHVAGWFFNVQQSTRSI